MQTHKNQRFGATAQHLILKDNNVKKRKEKPRSEADIFPNKWRLSLERSYPKSNSSSKTAIFAGGADIVFCFVLKFIIPFAQFDILFGII